MCSTSLGVASQGGPGLPVTIAQPRSEEGWGRWWCWCWRWWWWFSSWGIRFLTMRLMLKLLLLRNLALCYVLPPPLQAYLFVIKYYFISSWIPVSRKLANVMSCPLPSESTQRMTARHWSELANAAGPHWSDRRGRLRGKILCFGIPNTRISYV